MNKETKHLVEGANKWMYEDDGAEKWVNEKEKDTITAIFDRKWVNNTKLDELDALLVRAGFAGAPDFNALGYVFKREHLDRFKDIMKNQPMFPYKIAGEEIKEEPEAELEEAELFSLAEDLVSGLTYEQLINTIEANEQTKDEDAVDRVFEEELNRVIEDARENFELNKDKLMAGLTGEDDTNEGMFSKGKSKEEMIAKSMIKIIKDKGVDVKTVITLMMSKMR